MTVLCLVQIDPGTREATGTVVPFCSENCRHEAKSSLDFPDHTEGISNYHDFGFTLHCGQCNIVILPEPDTDGDSIPASVAAAEAALAAHEKALGIEGDASIQVWHLLVSLQDYCAARGVDFDKELAGVKESIASGEISAPACAALSRKSVNPGACGHHA